MENNQRPQVHSRLELLYTGKKQEKRGKRRRDKKLTENSVGEERYNGGGEKNTGTHDSFLRAQEDKQKSRIRREREGIKKQGGRDGKPKEGQGIARLYVCRRLSISVPRPPGNKNLTALQTHLCSFFFSPPSLLPLYPTPLLPSVILPRPSAQPHPSEQKLFKTPVDAAGLED